MFALASSLTRRGLAVRPRLAPLTEEGGVTIHPMGELKRGEAHAISTSPTKGKAGPAQAGYVMIVSMSQMAHAVDSRRARLLTRCVELRTHVRQRLGLRAAAHRRPAR